MTRNIPSGHLRLAFIAVAFGYLCLKSTEACPNDGVAVSSGDSQEATADSGALKILSWNVNYGNRDANAVAEVIRRADADVVCLQETTPQLERQLRIQVSERFKYVHSHGNDGRYFAERFMVLSRWPINKLTLHPPARRFFGTQTFQLKHLGRTISVANVHLAPFTTQGVRSLRGVLAEMGRTEADHTAEINTIFEQIPAADGRVIVGDFNSLSHFVAPMKLKSEGYVDSFAVVHEDADRHPTWHWPLGRGGKIQFRIDYIFHSPQLVTRASEILEASGSDHFPLLTELAWPDGNK